MIHVSWPQGLLVCWILIALLINANRHGKPYSEPHNFWGTALRMCLLAALLIWGGFFA